METRHDFDSIVMALHGRVSAEDALEAVGRLRARIAALEASLIDANSKPWLSDAHALCNAAAIPAGHISERLAKLREHVTSLEAEKAERERQEPVGFQVRYKGERTWGTIITHRAPDSFELRECEIRNLYAHPLALREPTEDECVAMAYRVDKQINEGPNGQSDVAYGRAIFNAARKVMTK